MYFPFKIVLGFGAVSLRWFDILCHGHKNQIEIWLLNWLSFVTK